MAPTLGYASVVAVVMAVFNYTGGKLSGWDRDPNVDEYERKEQLRKNRRRPIEETIAEVGEGRGEWSEEAPSHRTDENQPFTLLATRSAGARGSKRDTASRSRRCPLIPMIMNIDSRLSGAGQRDIVP